MSKKTGKGATDQAIDETYKELLGEPGKLKPYGKRLMRDYIENLKAKGRSITKEGDSGIKDKLLREGKAEVANLLRALADSPEFTNTLYKKSYEKLKALGDEGKSWGDLLNTEIYTDEGYLNEIFVRLVEEQEGVEITSAKQLQDLTGIKKIDGNAKGAERELKDTFIKAMDYRYCKTLENMLEAGASYNDLTKINPKDFHLPETWSGCLASDKKSSILRAIRRVFRLGELRMLRPDLRAVAEEIEAPYSILLEAHKWN